MEILIIRNKDCNYLYDVALVDYDGESSKYLQQFLEFDSAVEIQREYQMLYGMTVELDKTARSAVE